MGKVKLEIKPVSHKTAVYAVANYHYSKTMPKGRLIKFGVFEDDIFIGVVLYGLGANNNIGKKYNLKQSEVCELVRVALTKHKSNVSKIVSITLRLLNKITKKLKLVISYADLDQEHKGSIYQAMNFIYEGCSMRNSHDSSYMIKGKRTHGRAISAIVKKRGGLNGLSRDEFIKKYVDVNAVKNITKGKHKYIMPLDKITRKEVIRYSKPYPKSWSE